MISFVRGKGDCDFVSILSGAPVILVVLELAKLIEEKQK